MSIRKKAGTLFVGRVIYSLSQWFLVIFLANMADVESLDFYMLAVAITGPVIMLSQMNMRIYLVTDYDREYPVKDYLASRFVLSWLAFFFILVFGFFYIDSISGFQIILLVTVFKVVESLMDIYCGLFQRDSTIKLVALSNIYRGATAVLSMFLMLYFFESVFLALIFTCIAWFIIFIGHKIYADRNIDLGNDTDKYKINFKLIKKCIPLGFVMMLVSLNFNIPVYMVSYLNENESVGIYSSIAYLLLIGKVISESFVQASAPKLSEYISDNNYQMLIQISYKLFGLALLLGVCGLVFSLVFGELFLSIVYGEKFKLYNDVFIVIMLAALFSYVSQVYGMILTAWRNIKDLFFIHTFQVVSVILVGIMTIPEMGITGAAWSLVSGFFVTMILNFLLFKFKLKKAMSANI